MPRHDRKKWWEKKPTPVSNTPEPKQAQYYKAWGIVRDSFFTGEYVPGNGQSIWRPILKAAYKAVPYKDYMTHYIEERFTKAEAEALCKILNAAEEHDGGV